jgi:hypothetical protein
LGKWSYARFLHQLAPGGGFDRFAIFNESAGQRVTTFERSISPAYEQKASSPVEDDSIDC